MNSQRLTKIERQIAAMEEEANPGYMTEPFDLDLELELSRARLEERDRLLGATTTPPVLSDVMDRMLPLVRACAAQQKATRRKRWRRVKELSKDVTAATQAAHA